MKTPTREVKPTIEFVGSQVLIHLPKALLVMTRAAFVVALQKGKVYRRREQQSNRIKPHAGTKV